MSVAKILFFKKKKKAVNFVDRSFTERASGGRLHY